MTKNEALKHFDNSESALAKALGIRPSSIYDWGDEVPPLRQIQLQRITRGKLKAASDVFEKLTQRQRAV
jgi:transcriptional repressor of cell division inhibition gene dicB